MKSIIKILPIALLVLINQGIKIVIANNMMDKNYNLIGTIVGYDPYLNEQYSWINSLTNLGISRLVHMIIVILMFFVAIIIYDFVGMKYTMSAYVYWMLSFLMAGTFCSFIDKLVWGWSLDFILLKGFFIFDLKDVYLSVFEGMLILLFVLNKDIKQRTALK